MSSPVLSRIDLFITRDKSASDRAQVAVPGAVVEFYGQGATVAANATISASGSGNIEVFVLGDLKVGSTLKANGSGPVLTVTAVVSATEVTVSNAGAAVSVTTGMRLILTSERPTVYSDPLGTQAIGSSVTADNNGRVQGYINRRRYDYTVPGKVFGVAASTGSVSGGNVLSWNHDDTNTTAPQRVVLVGVSWAGSIGDETIDSVTYGGVGMTLVSTDNLTAVYRLANPPTGSQTVIVSFGATSPPAVVYAVGGAVSFSGVDGIEPLGAASTTSGSSTAPSVSVSATFADGLVFDTMGASGTTTATVGSGQTQQWNQASGGVPVRGCGSIEAGTGSSVTMSWTLGTSRPWGIIGIGLKPALQIHSDAVGGTQPSPSWLNARDFASIQDAIDALPANGGVVYLPAGEYEVVSTVTIPKDKPVHLLGDGIDRTIIFCDDKNENILWIKASYSTVENLTIRGVMQTPDGANDAERLLKGRGIVVGQVEEDDPSEAMRRVSIIGCRITETASSAYHVLGEGDEDDGAVPGLTKLLFGHVERCTFEFNNTANLVRLGLDVNGHVFMNTLFDHFGGTALHAFGANALSLISCTFEDKKQQSFPYVVLAKCRNVLLATSWFENHLDTDTSEYFLQVGDGTGGECFDVTVQSCRFVRNFGTLPKMIRISEESQSVVVANVTCFMANGPASRAGAYDVHVTDESEVYVSGGIIVNGSLTRSGLVMASDAIGTPLSTNVRFWSGDNWTRTGRLAPVTVTTTGTDTDGLLASGGAGFYRVSVYATGVSASTGIVTVTISWNDGTGRNQEVVELDTSISLALGGEMVLLLSEGAAIGYDVQQSGGAAAFEVTMRAEAF